jgi:hypothetical protein
MDSDEFEEFLAWKEQKKTTGGPPPQSAAASDAFASPLLLSDEEIAALGVKSGEAELYRRMVYQDSFSLSSWYDQLATHTFESIFISLTNEEVVLLLQLHHSKEPPQKQLQLLEQKMDKAIAALGGKVFVKLNTRSPKDVPIYDFENVQLQNLIRRNLLQIDIKKIDGLDLQNREVSAFVAASTQILAVSSGKAAIELLLKSQRVSEDLAKMKRFHSIKTPPVSKIVLRKWNAKCVRY